MPDKLKTTIASELTLATMEIHKLNVTILGLRTENGRLRSENWHHRHKMPKYWVMVGIAATVLVRFLIFLAMAWK